MTSQHGKFNQPFCYVQNIICAFVQEAQLVKYNDARKSVKVVKDAEVIQEDTVKVRQDALKILMMSSRGNAHEK